MPVQVVCHANALQSYWVQLENGYVVRRNRTQINTSKETRSHHQEDQRSPEQLVQPIELLAQHQEVEPDQNGVSPIDGDGSSVFQSKCRPPEVGEWYNHHHVTMNRQ